jgi:metallo-beta-lactamase family protein
MADRSLELTFLGANGTVTGSKHLLSTGRAQVLVDCGLYQGYKQLRLRNWGTLPVHDHPDAIVLTHAHLDHSGYLPRMVRNGYRGPVYCTPATAALCGLLLPDSAYLQELDAGFANKKGFSKHQPAEPLYTVEDAQTALGLLRTVEFEARFDLPGGLTGSLTRSGHILGAGSLLVDDGARKVLFSGDLGREQDLMMEPPHPRPHADVVVMESTYGGRQHDGDDPAEALIDVIKRVVARGGTIVIPAFAVGRTQALLLLLYQLRRAHKLPEVPIYVDSPMAIATTELYAAHPRDHRLSPELCAAAFAVAEYVRDAEGSKLLDKRGGPAIIISAAGMATGGRVVHHLKRFAPDPNSAIILAGFQAAGTRGASLAAGVDKLKIHGRYVPVNAEVVQLDMLSAHADQDELLGWLEHGDAPRCTYLVHGEPDASDALRHAIEEQLRWNVRVPDYRETIDIYAQ